jgi:hypothetical protein
VGEQDIGYRKFIDALVDGSKAHFGARVARDSMRGADASVFHEDQNIRGVQTFRDPATGKTQDLSNLYDHAWQDGTNDYILSNDPNFNPNEHVSGDWSELQAVNP